MKLKGYQVTRIEEELVRLQSNRRRHSHGDSHRAIEDFVSALVDEILVETPLPARQIDDSDVEVALVK